MDFNIETATVDELRKQLVGVVEGANLEALRSERKANWSKWTREQQNEFEGRWEAIGEAAKGLRKRLFELTGDAYGNAKEDKPKKPDDELLTAQYAEPGEVPAAVMSWIRSGRGGGLLTSDATDAVRWARIVDTLDDERLGEGDVTLYRAIGIGDDMVDEIRPGDWVSDQREYVEEHMSRWLSGQGMILEMSVDGRDVLASPTGNPEESIYAPREFSGPYVTVAPASSVAPAVQGAPVTTPPTETPRFKEWFEGSAVARHDGTPKVVFHGTHVQGDMGDVRSFDRKFTQKVFGRKQNIDMVGSWFSDSHDTEGAQMYAGINPSPNDLNGVIYPVYLAIKRPKAYDSVDAMLADFKAFHQLPWVSDEERARNGVKPEHGDADGFVAHLKNRGFDGVTIAPHSPPSRDMEFAYQRAWIAFDAHQVQFAISPFSPEHTPERSYVPPDVRIDNPGGSWLDSKRRAVIEDGLTDYGSPAYCGPITGSFDRRVMLPVKLLAGLPGLRKEQDLVREPDLRSLLEYCREHGRFPPAQSGSDGQTYDPFVQVMSDGKAWVNEGNHRIMVADILGWEYVPVDVRYFSGGEMLAREFAIANLLKFDQQAHESGYTPAEYGGKYIGSEFKPVPMSGQLEMSVLARLPQYALVEVSDTLTSAFDDVGRQAALKQILDFAQHEAERGRPRFGLEDANGNVVGSFTYCRERPDGGGIRVGDGKIRVVVDLMGERGYSVRGHVVGRAIAAASALVEDGLVTLVKEQSDPNSSARMTVLSAGVGPIAQAEIALRNMQFDLASARQVAVAVARNQIGAVEGGTGNPQWVDGNGVLTKEFYVRDPDSNGFIAYRRAVYQTRDSALRVLDRDGNDVEWLVDVEP